MVTKGGKGRREKLGVWDKHIHTTIYKINNQQGPLYGTENYTQHIVIIYKGKESEITESLCCSPKAKTIL